ncbi:MAG: bifunctional NADH dehydrogenase FAD-containing subunit/selenide, water dikinase SelD, partial [Candidatus Tectomicrobia bacterium]|nr:bifunctional NADH dehydrogenase FAD-containing subunit/selenide, water dikinase SelD [Candidatus Tectomicrobia bacterium]
VDAGGVRDQTGQYYALDVVLWVTDAVAPAWLGAAGLAVDARGFVRVNAALQSVSHPEVFAAGDVATVEPYPREKAGVIAVRQGTPLARNLRRVLMGHAPRPFVPQHTWLALISTGDQYAVASWGAWSLEGRWVWHWKNWLDRRFVRKYRLSLAR